MKTLYLDLFSGISGDMFLGALIDLGLDFEHLQRELAKLPVTGYHLHIARGRRAQIEGTKFDVHLGHHRVGIDPAMPLESAETHEHTHEHHHHHHHHHAHESGGHTPADPEASAPAPSHEHEHVATHEHAHGHNHAEIQQMISNSALSQWVKEKALAVFARIAVAEGKIHGVPPENVHFHEVGAVDSIIDIVGSCIGLEFLGQPRVLAGLPIEGSGWIDCAHGRFPIPAPATLEIFAARAVAITQCEATQELITPTGAALLAEFAESFAPMKNLAPTRIGFGLGSRDNPGRPNVLRAILGETAATTAHDWEKDTIAVLEANLDDTTPEVLGRFMETALAAGALDVTYAALQMKKNRPGVQLTVLCGADQCDAFCELILRETSSFGVRHYLTERRKLRREFKKISTPYGEVTLKLGRLDGKICQAAPEFESCKALADGKNVPIKLIYEAAVTAWNQGTAGH